MMCSKVCLKTGVDGCTFNLNSFAPQLVYHLVESDAYTLCASNAPVVPSRCLEAQGSSTHPNAHPRQLRRPGRRGAGSSRAAEEKNENSLLFQPTGLRVSAARIDAHGQDGRGPRDKCQPGSRTQCQQPGRLDGALPAGTCISSAVR